METSEDDTLDAALAQVRADGREWEQHMADTEGDADATLFVTLDGYVDWIRTCYWDAPRMIEADRTLLKHTTLREAVAFKWIANG